MRSNVSLGVIGGLVYGVLLAVIAFGDADNGKGTYVMLGLFSSPLGLARSLTLAFVGTPILWALLGTLAGSAHHTWARVAFIFGMLIHYGAAVLVLTQGGYFGDLDHVLKYPDSMLLALGAYLIGQIALWTLYTVSWLTQLPIELSEQLASESSAQPTV